MDVIRDKDGGCVKSEGLTGFLDSMLHVTR
jgi:hypothetical protein